uniref:MHC class II protein n=2 Tax=Ginglymostoma cirratum TaxID=7801 RepID=Q31397_GINCI|nr:MHC class II protein [Ginglymostoma cirratum]
MEARNYFSVLVLVLIQGGWAGKYLYDFTQVYFVQQRSPEKHFDVMEDGDEIFYMDFNLKKEVARIPEFAHLYMQGGEAGISANIAIVKNNLKVVMNLSGGTPEPKVPPEVSVYSEDLVEWGQLNTLICFADGFYPPHITMKWRRNNEPMTDGDNITEFYIKDDFTYRRFSYLSIVPSPGDMYSCHVEHSSLQDPVTVFWDQGVPEEKSGPGTIICALGLTLGIISAVVGIILLIKERQRLQAQQHGI